MLILMNGNEEMTRVPEGSWFTLPDGRSISPAMAGWSDGEYSLIEEAVVVEPEPTPEELLQAERATMQLSFAQMLIGLVAEEWITEADARGWLVGTLPPTVVSTISLLPPEQQFAATAKATAPSVVLRLDPLVGALAITQGRTPEEVDDFFRTYALA